MLRTISPRIALAVLLCVVAVGCTKRRKSVGVDLVTPKIHFILHCTDDEYSVFDDDFENLKDETIFGASSIFGSLAAAGQPAGPTSGGLFAANSGPLGDTASILLVGTNFDERTTFNWVDADTTSADETGFLNLGDLDGDWISENCVEIVPPASPLEDGSGNAEQDGYVDIISSNPNIGNLQAELAAQGVDTVQELEVLPVGFHRFEGVRTLGHTGAWLYVSPNALSATAIALESKLPSNMLLCPGQSGIPVLVTLANSTTDDIIIESGALSFSGGSGSLNSFVNAFADYRGSSSEAPSSGSFNRLTVPAGGTATLPFLVNIANHFPTGSDVSQVTVAVTVAGESRLSKGAFAASLTGTDLFQVSRSPLVKTHGGDVWSANPQDMDAGNGGSIFINENSGTIDLTGTAPSVSAPSLGGTDPSDTFYDTGTSFANTLRITGSDTLGVDLTEFTNGEITSDTVTIAGSIVSDLDSTERRAFNLQIGSSTSPADVVVFDGASITLAGESDGASTQGSGNQGAGYDGSGGSIEIHTTRFVCVNSNIDLRAGNVTGGPFSGFSLVGSSGSFTVFIYDGFTGDECEVSGSSFNLDGADSSGDEAGDAGSFGVFAEGTDVDVVLVSTTVNANGGSSFGTSANGLPAHVSATSNGSFSAGDAGNVSIENDAGDLGDVTVVGGQYCLTGGHAAVLNGFPAAGVFTSANGGDFDITGGVDIVLANDSGVPATLSTNGGVAGRFGGFGDDTADSQAGSAGEIGIGDTDDTDDINIPDGAVLCAVGGSSDNDASGHSSFSSSSGGFVEIACDDGVVTIGGYICTQGGYSREDENGDNGISGNAGNVSVFADRDGINVTSTGVIFAVGGSAALYGNPVNGESTLDFSGSADISSGAGGNVSLDAESNDGTDADDGDIDIAGRIFTNGGFVLDSSSASPGDGGDLFITTGTQGNNDNEGDLNVTGTICLSGGVDVYSGFGEGNGGRAEVEVDGGSLTWSGLFEALGANTGDWILNDNNGTSQEADGDCVLSGDWDIDDVFLVSNWQGERINFSGTIGSSSEEASLVQMTNSQESGDGNDEEMAYSGTSWASSHNINTEYSISMSGTMRSFQNSSNIFVQTNGTTGGSNVTDPDLSVSGTMQLSTSSGTPLSGSNITLGHDDADQSDDANINLTGVFIANSFVARIGLIDNDDEGDITLNGSTMTFGSFASATVREGDITLPSGRTIDCGNFGTALFTVDDHPSTVAEELISLAGTVRAGTSINVTINDNTDEDPDISITGTLDASGSSSNRNGGTVEISLASNLTLSGSINVDGFSGLTSGTDHGGFGGIVTITDVADDSIPSEENWSLAGSISADGGSATTATPGYFSEGGSGGLVTITHLGDDEDETFTLSTSISANGGSSVHGPGGFGGVVAVANLESSSGASNGGILTLAGSTTATGGSSTFESAGYGGNGGNIFYAGGEVVVGGSHNASAGDGPAAGGNGGNLSVTGVSDFTNGVAPVTGSGSLTGDGGDATNNGFAGNGGSIFLDNDSGGSTSPSSSITTSVAAGSGSVAGVAGTVHSEP